MADAVSDALAEWMERLEQERTPELEQAFAAWLSEDPARRHEYEQIERQIGYLRAAGRQSRYSEEQEALRRQRVKRMALGLGAMAAIAATIAWFVAPVGSAVVADQPLRIAELTRPVRYEDGTIAILAVSAQAVAQMGGTYREVVLRGGSARFIVARDEARPMTIKAPGLEIRTNGGIVDVEVNGGRACAISRGAGAQMRSSAPALPWVQVAEGQSLVAGTTAAATVAAEPAPLVTVVEADGLSLGDLLIIVNGSGPPVIAAEGDVVRSRKLSGRFDVRDHPALVRRLAGALDLAVKEEAGRLVLAGR